jgi:hypothetical protein
VAEYVAQLEATRAVTIAELQKLTESDLDRPTLGNLANFCPTLGNTFGLLCDHIMMHLGQGTVVRRKAWQAGFVLVPGNELYGQK